MPNLTERNDSFYLGDAPFQIRSGAIHYFRSMPDDWADRLRKLKACGLNTVETYVPWNFHEPNEEEFCFSGTYDLERFLTTATSLGLYIILRPGPYICAEWDFGGLPWWLLKYPNIQLRCMDEVYLSKVDRYFDELIPKILPFLSTNGGNIIAVQVENEYGSYGTDGEYLLYMKDALIRRGVDVLLFTSDGPNPSMLTGGTIEGVLPTVNFGSNPEGNMSEFEKRFPNKPKMCTEYWDGWFDQWGYLRTIRAAQEISDDIACFMQHGWSFNLYMFHGGTNFGFWNGANQAARYQPDITSYDYGALLSEDGQFTEKYYKVKELLNPEEPLPPFIPRKKAVGKVKLKARAGLFENLELLSSPVESAMPKTFESLNLGYGFVLYRTVVKAPREPQKLKLLGLHDRAQIFVDGKEEAVFYRGEDQQEMEIEVKRDSALDILVENMGRVNYGAYLKDEKGILGGVSLGNGFQHGYRNYPISFENIDKLPFVETHTFSGPAFFSGTFHVETPDDCFLCLEGFTKGVVFLNGFNLGRYWNIGPQHTLYVPRSILNNGENNIVIFELHHGSDSVTFIEERKDY